MTGAALELKGIQKEYRSGDESIYALKDITLSIMPGEFVAVMGQSGSGKSTLMNIIGCLDQPTAGSYTIFGRETSQLTEDELAALRREVFGFVFQRYHLLPATAEGNVSMPAIYAGLDVATRRSRARDLLTRLGLKERLDHYPSQLSGGQQQRVAIARALMNDAPILLADEPTGALDSHSGAEVMELLKSLNRDGRTIVLITHDAKVAENAQRIIHVLDGSIVKETRGAGDSAAAAKAKRPFDFSGGLNWARSAAEALGIARQSLRQNIFRTALTLLGIIIGVAAVVTMLAVGTGSKQKVIDQISAMGTNLLSVRPGAPGVRTVGDIITLVPDDAKAMTMVPNVTAVMPERSLRMTTRYGNADYQTTIDGVGEMFPQVRDWKVSEGLFFTANDVSSYAPVALLGQTVYKNLFPGGGSPIGQYILIKNVPFQIIGLMETKGASSFGTDQDDTVLIPYTTGLVRLFGKTYISTITAQVADVTRINDTQEDIRQLLIQRHRAEDFSIRNMTSILETANETQNTLTLLLGVVAGISLLVGGIGVMNIMLVSVTERTREIGLRMATGARGRDIMLQFNIEAAVVCAFGGIIGVIVGIAAGLITQAFGIPVVFSVWPASAAFLSAFATGLVFGYLPARKAAQLNPVVALASE